MPCGSLPAPRFPAFLTNLQAAFSKAKKRKGDERSAHVDERQGHQRTPAMILALALQALRQTASGDDTDGDGSGVEQPAEEGEQVPRGGYTDVGLHTGGTPRDTAWPLVREALKVSWRPAVAALICCTAACLASAAAPACC